MLAAASAGQSVVASILALGTAGLAGAIITMVWSLQSAQAQRGGPLGRLRPGRPADAGPAPGGPAADRPAVEVPAADRPAVDMPAADMPAPGAGFRRSGGPAKAANGSSVSRPPGGAPPLAVEAEEVRRPDAPPSAIEGPDSVVIGEQARYRVRRSPAQQVVSWAAGGGAVSQASDPAHPDDLLLVADRPGNLTVSVRLREGLAERRETKSVTAVADPETAVTAVASRLLLQDWPVVTVAVLVAGFAAALVALGSLGVADFIALVAPLTAMLAVVAATRGSATRAGR